MKLLYQFILSFFFMTLLILTVVGLIFNHLTSDTLIENNYQELTKFAQSIKMNAEDQDAGNGETKDTTMLQYLRMAKSLIQNQDINLYLVKPDGNILYPEGIGKNHKRVAITKEEWEEMQKGEIIKKHLPTDFFLHEEERTYVMVPYKKIENTSVLYGAIIATQPTKIVQSKMETVLENLIRAFLVSTLVAIVFSYIFSSGHVSRLNRLRLAAGRVAEGDFSERVSPRGSDEISELAVDFNVMALALENSAKEIEHQEEQRKQFMADASHEMRTPLTTIGGILEGFEYGMIPEEEKKNAIRLMKNETDRLIRLVKDNLDYEKIRTGQITLNLTHFNGVAVLEDVKTQMSSKAHDKGNEILLESDAAEEVQVYADNDRFKQILVNITNNALQFTENGQILLSIHENGQYVVVSIRDTGIGMTEEAMRNIWERYFKADPSRKNTTGESGLGLSIVQQLMKLHHGEV
ncbi:MAG: HAMP domain-containing protein, partial [Streptococcaceae bacterium]|nr:HAMP domain-containing protein [Streptococcaceae bacterium]